MAQRAWSGAALLALALLSACGTPTFDMAGYPDAARDRLYRDGRLGGDKGLTDFDLRKAWRAVAAAGS
jgi:hypothetical protein